MEKKRSHIFISYAKEDINIAKSIYKRLTEAGLNVWLDDKNLQPGQEWRPAIEQAIEKSRMVLILLSEKSVNKTGFFQKEVLYAIDIADMQPEGTVYIVPLKIEECKVPIRLKKYHWIELFNKEKFSDWINKLKGTEPSIFSVAKVEFTYKSTAWRMEKYLLSYHNLLYPNGREVNQAISLGETDTFEILPGYYSFYLEYAEWFLEPIHRSYYEKSVKTNLWEGKLLPGLHKFQIRRPEGFEFQSIENGLRIASWPVTFFALYKQRITLEKVDFQPWTS